LNSSEIISSGVLESYVLGLLSDAETNEVQQWAKQYPEVQSEINEIEQTLSSLAQLKLEPPDAQLKARIWKSIQSNQAGSNPISNQTPVPSPALVRKAHSTYRWLVAASGLLLILSIVCNVYFYQKWKATESEMAVVQNERTQIADQLERTSLRTCELSSALNLISIPGTATVSLQATDSNQVAHATVIWNPVQKAGYITEIRLPKISSENQYQLWAIVNGKPVNAGLIPQNWEPSTAVKMLSLSEAQAFAITIEPAGGKPEPTLSQLVAMGNVQ